METRWCKRPGRLRLLVVVVLLTLGMGIAGTRAPQALGAAPLREDEPDLNRPETCGKVYDFDRDNFPNSPRINNGWFPLIPGTQYVLEGGADRGGGVRPHRVVFTITDLVKVINGVRTVVVFDRDYNDGELSEAELAFFAQDKAGNVWSLGEYPEEFEDGEFAGAPSTWIAGRARAKAGVMMPNNPKLGDRQYLQGWMRLIEFLDCARVYQEGVRVCVPTGCYDNVLVTQEQGPLEPDSGYQRKFYARGVGVIKVTAVADQENETLEETKRVRLSPKALAEARMLALRLDRRAYLVARWYRKTAPATRDWSADDQENLALAPFPAAPTVAAVRVVPTFSAPTTISNVYFPASTISQTVWLGSSAGQPARLEATLLPETKTISWSGGATPVQVIQLVSSTAGKLDTVSYLYLAQADGGDVYLFGEDVTNYLDGKASDNDGSWLAGQDGAEPVLLVPAQPQVGAVYNQGSAPSVVHGEDTVLSLNEPVMTNDGLRQDGLLIRETRIEGSLDYKLYLPGVGLVENRLDYGRLELALQQQAGVSPPALPEALRTIANEIEVLNTALQGGDKTTAGASLAAIDASWTAYQAAGHLPLALQQAFTSALHRLRLAILGGNTFRALDVTADLSLATADLVGIALPPAPVDLGRLAVLERRVGLKATAKDLAGAADALAQAEAIWLRLKPTLLAQGNAPAVAQFEASLNTQRTALQNGSGAALGAEAGIGFQLLTTIELLY